MPHFVSCQSHMEAELVIHRSHVLPEDETSFNRRPKGDQLNCTSVRATAVLNDGQLRGEPSLAWK